MASPLPSDATVLATRLLEAHFQAREAFTRSITPVLHEKFDLDLRDYMILRWIDQQHLTPGGLARMLHIPGYATSRLLDPFIKRHLVQRVIDPDDARRYRLHVTDEGRTVIQTINQEVTRLLTRMLNDLGPERTELLLESLHTMAQLEAPLPADLATT